MTLLKAAVAATAAAAVLASVPGAHAAPVQRTRVITMVPTLPAGTPRNGSCWTRSIAAPYRADAYRCMVGNAIFDPCFSLPDQPGLAVCDANPATGTRGFALRLTKPLPDDSAATGQPTPWLVQLGEAYCVPLTGTHPLIGKNNIGYECRSSGSHTLPISSGLIDGSIQRSSVWTARLLQYREADGKQVGRVTTVALVAVWL